MKARPILFSGPMVRAILEGRKTQTRRIVKPQPIADDEWAGGLKIQRPKITVSLESWNAHGDLPQDPPLCPYGRPGDREWHPGRPTKEGYYHIRGLLDDGVGGDNRPVYYWPQYGTWGFSETDDPEALENPDRPEPGDWEWNGWKRPGDLLWVRETIWQAKSYPMTMPSGESDDGNWGAPVYYAADGEPPNTPNRHYPNGLRGGHFAAPDPYASWHKRPSIHMPRWASRLTLRITNVRVERLQDISEEDARAEGITVAQNFPAIPSFVGLWSSINGPGSWDENPWVWVVEFDPTQQNVDRILEQSS